MSRRDLMQASRDWTDGWGHRWRFDPERQVWEHDREKCQLPNGRKCEP